MARLRDSDFKKFFKDAPLVKMKKSKIIKRKHKPYMSRIKSGKKSWLSTALK